MTAEQTPDLEQALAERQKTSKQIVDVDEPQTKLVIFRLQDRHFAFPGQSISEIISGQFDVFYVPGMHASVEGVMNLRGDIQSVLRLNELLQLPDSDTRNDTQKILLGHSNDLQTGIRIDELLDVTDIPHSQLKSPPESLPAHLKPLVTALLEFNGIPVSVLDLDLLLQEWQQHLS